VPGRPVNNRRPSKHSVHLTLIIIPLKLKINGQLLVNASALPDARSRREVQGGEDLRARPVKPFGRGRPCADAGPMQIQLWEGTVLECGETVPQSAIPDPMGQSVGYDDKVF
jgi:hypothetical protein